jgi:sulfatase modifying factor 1
MRWKSSLILIFFIVITISCNFAFADCPSSDLTGDCFVDYEDFSVMAAQWLTTDPCVPDDMAYIPDSEFEMGDHHDGMSNALPIHTVTLNSFYMSKYEITNQQYCDYLNSAILTGGIKVDRGVVYDFNDTNNIIPYCDTSTSYPFSQIDYSGGVFSVRTKDGTTDMSDHPMVTVCWYGAAAYCNWRSQQEGYEQCYALSTWDCDFSKKGYRLSTEAEWEYAARGGKHSPYYRYPWGDSIDGSKANNEDSGDPFETGDIPWTTPVGYYDGDQIPAGGDMVNGYGLYDMAGNVWEWCNDWYNSTYYSTSPYDNPRGPVSGDNRVLRGGGWDGFDLFCRVNFRFNFRPVIRASYFGFRVVLSH